MYTYLLHLILFKFSTTLLTEAEKSKKGFLLAFLFDPFPLQSINTSQRLPKKFFLFFRVIILYLIFFFLRYLENPDPTKPFPPIKKIIHPTKLGSIFLSGDNTFSTPILTLITLQINPQLFGLTHFSIP